MDEAHDEDRAELLAFARKLNELGAQFPRIHVACAIALTRDTETGGHDDDEVERVNAMVASQVNGRAAVLRFAVREMLRHLDQAEAPADTSGAPPPRDDN